MDEKQDLKAPETPDTGGIRVKNLSAGKLWLRRGGILLAVLALVVGTVFGIKWLAARDSGTEELPQEQAEIEPFVVDRWERVLLAALAGDNRYCSRAEELFALWHTDALAERNTAFFCLGDLDKNGASELYVLRNGSVSILAADSERASPMLIRDGALSQPTSQDEIEEPFDEQALRALLPELEGPMDVAALTARLGGYGSGEVDEYSYPANEIALIAQYGSLVRGHIWQELEHQTQLREGRWTYGVLPLTSDGDREFAILCCCNDDGDNGGMIVTCLDPWRLDSTWQSAVRPGLRLESFQTDGNGLFGLFRFEQDGQTGRFLYCFNQRGTYRPDRQFHQIPLLSETEMQALLGKDWDEWPTNAAAETHTALELTGVAALPDDPKALLRAYVEDPALRLMAAVSMRDLDFPLPEELHADDWQYWFENLDGDDPMLFACCPVPDGWLTLQCGVPDEDDGSLTGTYYLVDLNPTEQWAMYPATDGDLNDPSYQALTAGVIPTPRIWRETKYGELVYEWTAADGSSFYTYTDSILARDVSPEDLEPVQTLTEAEALLMVS